MPMIALSNMLKPTLSTASFFSIKESEGKGLTFAAISVQTLPDRSLEKIDVTWLGRTSKCEHGKL